MAVRPFMPVLYDNRTDFTTLSVLQPAIPYLMQCDGLAWSVGVYGWFDTMRIHIPRVHPAAAYWFLEQTLGRMTKLRLYGATLWEGLVWEVSALLPGCTLTRSLADMANKVYVEYSLDETSTNSVSSASQDTTLQGIYGVKEYYVAGGTRGSTDAGYLADRYLASHKHPPTIRSMTDRARGLAEVTIDCKGYYNTLAWKYYTSTATGTQATGTTLSDINTSCGAFIASTNLAATGRTAAKRFAQRQTAWEQMLSLIALGTSNDLRYFLGVKAGRVLTGWEEPTTLSYIKYPQLPGQYFDATGNFPLQFWQVEPGKWVRAQLSVSDNLPVSDENPRAMLIGSCEYDAVARTVKPNYNIRTPTVSSATASAGQEFNPFERPWTTYEWYKQGYRTFYYKGQWITQYRRGWEEYGTHKDDPWQGTKTW